jgi:hypothetical protein
MAQSSFERALMKGELAEAFVRKHFEHRGWVCYKHFTTNKAHGFDIMGTINKGTPIIFEVKAKARLNKFDATGVDKNAYNKYKKFVEESGMIFWLIFVDEYVGDVRGQEFKKLGHPIELKSSITGLTYCVWYRSTMKYFFDLTGEQMAQLSTFNQRNYDFDPNSNPQGDFDFPS